MGTASAEQATDRIKHVPASIDKKRFNGPPPRILLASIEASAYEARKPHNGTKRRRFGPKL